MPKAKAAATTSNGHDMLREVEQLLYRQAECLDGKRWQDFIELFTDDGVYWMPAAPEQTTGDGVPSIFWEDRDLMTVRAEAAQPSARLVAADGGGTNHPRRQRDHREGGRQSGDLVVRLRFHMMEFRNDTIRHFAGSYVHHLEDQERPSHSGLQRVDMVNAPGPYEYVLQAWV